MVSIRKCTDLKVTKIVMSLSIALLFSACGQDDSVYSEVHDCDQAAAHPKDPERMTTGVSMESIVPKPALDACEQAVREYPETPRFYYQYGRALEASRSFDRAVSMYQKAADMGYGAAFYNLGIAYADGKGVPLDPAKAEQYIRLAIENKFPGEDMLASLVFSPEGYSSPELFRALYDGTMEKLQVNPTDFATYLQTFVELFLKTEGCGRVISSYAYSKLAEHATMNVWGKFLGGMANAQRNHAPGDFAGAAGAGYDAGREFNLNIASMIDKGQQDAQLFYSRHGCDTPVAQTFFKRVNDYAAKVGTPSFTKELERNFKR